MPTTKCPLCGSALSQNQYYKIVGVWDAKRDAEARMRLEVGNLKKQKDRFTKEKIAEKRRFQNEQRILRAEMNRRSKQAIKEGVLVGKAKEKGRAERLAKSVHNYTEKVKEQNERIRELQGQLKKGTTPQIDGLSFEKSLFSALKKQFRDDKFLHTGKGGDILQTVMCRGKEVGRILYECKITAKYNNAFIRQTRKAKIAREATYALLVTRASKSGTAGFFVERDILVVHPYGAVHLASILRSAMIDLFVQDTSEGESDKRSIQMMRYIRSDEFKSVIRDSIDRTRELYSLLVKEMGTHKKTWNGRHEHYQALHMNSLRLELSTTNIVRGLPPKASVVARQKALPQLK